MHLRSWPRHKYLPLFPVAGGGGRASFPAVGEGRRGGREEGGHGAACPAAPLEGLLASLAGKLSGCSPATPLHARRAALVPAPCAIPAALTGF